MLLTISHTTTYRYGSPVRYGLQELRLRPRDDSTQTVLEWEIALDGGVHQLSFDDHYGNSVDLVSVDPGTTEIRVTATGRVDTTDANGAAIRHLGHAPLWLYLRSTEQTEAGAGVARFCDVARNSDDDLERLHGLAAQIREAVAYRPGESDVASSAEDAIEAGAGVCQDHSHIFIAAARSLGYSARYVSGYLLLGDTVDQDASHAWAEAYVDGLGWVGFDVSNGISPDDRYVRLATGLDYRAAAPIRGVTYGAGDESLEVELQVQSGNGGQQ